MHPFESSDHSLFHFVCQTLQPPLSARNKDLSTQRNGDLFHETFYTLTLRLDLCVNFFTCICLLMFLKKSNDVLVARLFLALLSTILTSVRSSFFLWHPCFFDTFSRRESRHQRKSNVLPFNLRGLQLSFGVLATDAGAIVTNSSDVWLIIFKCRAKLQTGSKPKEGFASTILSKIISDAIYFLALFLLSR